MITENKLYNPASQTKEWLIANFVVRTKVFEKLFKEISTANMKNAEQHYIVQGQRGMGKTTLLLRLKYEVENTPSINNWLIPVFFNEESYDLTSLSNLWEKLLKYLDELWQTGGSLYNKTNEFVEKPDYEKKCFNFLIDTLKAKEKKLLILFDNFGQLFLDNLSERDQHRLREILMNSSDIRIIGASAVVMSDLHDYSKPFFDFFKIIPLDGLNKNETFQLIQKLQEHSQQKLDLNKNKGKIDTLAILTGGVIRTIMLIYETILADENGSALKDLEVILDRITPLYKHRMEDLSVQQRRIVDVVAKAWDGISAKEISKNIREDGKQMPTKIISAQLQQLERNDVIEKKQTTTKNHIYQLNERFFNIWYLMRHGSRQDQCRVKWLTRFLELWYDNEDSMGNFALNHIVKLRSGSYFAESAILIAEAISSSTKIDIAFQHQIIEETKKILNEEQKKQLPKSDHDKFTEAVNIMADKKYLEATSILESIVSKGDEVYLAKGVCYLRTNLLDKAIETLSLIKADQASKYLYLGEASLEKEENQTALKNYLLALEQPQQTNRGFVLYKLASLYESRFNDTDNAVKYYTLAVENGNVEVYFPLTRLLRQTGKYEECEKRLIEGIDRGLYSLQKNLINLYLYRLNKESEAIELMKTYIAKFPEDPDYNFLMGMTLVFGMEYATAKKHLINAKETAKQNTQVWQNADLADYLLAHVYFEENNKLMALETIKGFDDDSIQQIGLLIVSAIHLWNNEFDRSQYLFDRYLMTTPVEQIEKELDQLQDIILLLLAKKQYHTAIKIFEAKEAPLKDLLKPIYYTLIHYLKDEYPNEIVKMGDELQQPVQDIIKKVEKIALEYK